MAKLSDLVNVNHNVNNITVQEASIPIAFTMETMEFIGDVYGDYAKFEEDINNFLAAGSITFNAENFKIIRALIYGMIRSGGTECTHKELSNSIPFNQLVPTFQACLEVFTAQNFEVEDLKK
ncbi:Phage protein [Brachybacterium faecium]|nr:Phage protein [Brachybacterium faecium]